MIRGGWFAEARRRWGKRALWIEGDAQFALLAWCGGLKITLWPTPEQAERRKTVIDKTMCGAGCTGRHEIIDLSMDVPARYR